jgi:PEP-CTERM motif
MRMKTTGVAVFLLVFLAIPACASSIFTLTGTATLSGQGFGTIYTILSLHNNGTEMGAVAPTNALNLSALASFGTCSVQGGIDLCGDATNQSEVITAANLASLSFTSTSTFGLLYNVNQQGNASGLNTFLNSPTPFTVYFYSSSGAVLFDASYGGRAEPFPPATQNGQGTAGWLFALSGTDFAANFSSIAYIGMSGTIANANDGADNWSVLNAGGGGGGGTLGGVPEPLSLFLMGGGLLGVGIFGKFRRA